MEHLSVPPTRYAASGDISVAYQVWGERPVDLVMVPGVVSHLEAMHELPGYTSFFQRLSRFARVIAFDKRGQGLSDRIVGAPSLEERIDDIRAVMDAAGSQRAAVMGFSQGAALALTFAAIHPDRVSSVICFGAAATGAQHRVEGYAERIEKRVERWGDGALVKFTVSPDAPVADETMRQFGKIERLMTTPAGIRALMRLDAQIDVRPVLEVIRTPCLVLHRRTDPTVPIEQGRLLAQAIPGARLVEFDRGPHGFWVGDPSEMLGEIEELVTGDRQPPVDDLERVLSTVLFTDIHDSTRNAAAMGDRRWRELLDQHDRLARQYVERHRGRPVKMTGDGILATFDGPGRAVRCALALADAIKDIGLAVRAGLHTGEIELRGQDVGGVAVHAAARVMGLSAPGEVLVSRVVTDLVAGAGLQFADRGSHELKGLPGRWELFAASV